MTARKVLYFASNYHRFTGSQRSLRLLVLGLDRGRYEPVVVFPGEGACTQAYREAGLRVIVEPPPPVLDQFGGGLARTTMAERMRIAATALPSYTATIRKVIARERPHIVHLNNTRSMLMAGFAAISARLPTIWHVRSDERSLGIFSASSAAMATRILLVADALHTSVPRPFLRKCRTVHNGIDPPSSPPRRLRSQLLAGLEPLPLDPDGLLVVVVGSVIPFKGGHHLLDALASLRADGAMRRKLGVVFVGDRPVEPFARLLDAKVAALELDNVRFAGWDNEPLDWIRAADLVCLPTVERDEIVLDGVPTRVSGTEGFSRTVLEAMACARPVVASAVAGVPEQVVDGETGLLVQPCDPVALAAALRQLVLAPPEKRVRMGQAGLSRVTAHFSVSEMARRTMAVYDELA